MNSFIVSNTKFRSLEAIYTDVTLPIQYHENYRYMYRDSVKISY